MVQSTEEKKGEAKKVAKAYQKATTQLRDNHREEFNNLMRASAKDAGVEWEPKKTKAQKDEQKLKDILNSNPDLAARLRAELLGGEEGQSVELSE